MNVKKEPIHFESDNRQQIGDIKIEVREPIASSSGHLLQSATNSTDGEDMMMNGGDWGESEILGNDTSKSQQAPYRMFFDSREQKLQEKIEFVRIVYKHKTQLFGDCDGHEVTPRSKEDAWKKVQAEVEQSGLESYKGKTWARLRDHDWQYVRRHALSRSENTTRPGGKLGELDKIVLEIISTSALSNSVNQVLGVHSQQSTDSVEQYLKTFLSGVNQDSCETPELGSFEIREPRGIDDPMTIQTSSSTDSNILDILQKVVHTTTVPQTLSLDSAGMTIGGRQQQSRSPISSRKMTNRSATAPSVYAITSSTSPPQASTSSLVQAPCAKKLKLDGGGQIEKSPTGSISNGSSSHSGGGVCSEQKREALILRKLDAEVRRAELENEKLEKEIRIMEAAERRSAELHQIEMRAAKARLMRGLAIDEPSIDRETVSIRDKLIRRQNGI